MSEIANPMENAVSLGDLFRINTAQITPKAFPGKLFTHYSIPAYDELHGAAIESSDTIESNKFWLSNPCILVSKLNPRKPRVKSVADPGDFTCASTEFICFEPRSDNQVLKFWEAYFASGCFSARLAKVAVGSTNSHTRATPRETLRWLVPNPAVAMQSKIAEVLDTLDAAIRGTEAVVAKLQAMKQGLLHDLLTRGIDANGDLRPPQPEAPHLYHQTPLGWLPKEWDVGRVAEQFDIQLGKMLDSEKNRGEVKAYLGNKAVQWDRIELSEAQTVRLSPSDLLRFRLEPGDLLVCEGGEVGRAAVWSGELEECYYQKALHRLRPIRGYSPRLMLEILRWYVERDFLNEYVSKTSIAHLTQEKLAVVPLFVPSIEEQNEIENQIMSIRRRLETENRLLDKLRLQKSGLMEDQLTGRVSVAPLL